MEGDLQEQGFEGKQVWAPLCSHHTLTALLLSALLLNRRVWGDSRGSVLLWSSKNLFLKVEENKIEVEVPILNVNAEVYQCETRV